MNNPALAEERSLKFSI